MRRVIRSREFDAFFERLPSEVQEKMLYALTVISDSFIESGQVLLLNGFVKKSTKDYRKEVDKARRILNLLETNNI